MNDQNPSKTGKPRTDDRLLWDIITGIYGRQAVLLAHDLKLFPLLAKGPLTAARISEALHLAPRPAEAILSVCASLGLLQLKDGGYALTPVAEDYLLPDGPAYFGNFIDVSLANGVLAYESLKQAVLSNSPQVYDGVDLYASHGEQAMLAREFTRMMHSHSRAPALAWPDRVDLSGYRTMLDVGGGSGAHAIGAVCRWPALHALILDLPSVCPVAEEFIAAAGLRGRISTRHFDIWSESFPAADLHFYSDIFHDFTPEKCRYLAHKSMECLASGGRIIIHEMLYDEGKAGPFTVAGYNVSMLLWTEGQQFSGEELAQMLAEAGFAAIEVISTFGYWGIVTGRKP